MFTKPQTFGSKGYAVIIRILFLLFLPTKEAVGPTHCVLSLAIAESSIGLRPMVGRQEWGAAAEKCLQRAYSSRSGVVSAIRRPSRVRRALEGHSGRRRRSDGHLHFPWCSTVGPRPTGKARSRLKRGLRRAGSEYPEYPANSGRVCDVSGACATPSGGCATLSGGCATL